MKFTFFLQTLVLLTSCALAADPATSPPNPDAKAPEVPKPPPPPPPAFVSPAGTAESKLKLLSEQVTLTADQQKKLKALLTKGDPAVQQAVAAWRNSRTTEDRNKLSELMKAQNAEIGLILTEDQKTKSVTAQNQVPTQFVSPPGRSAAGAGTRPGGFGGTAAPSAVTPPAKPTK